jgi:hypothetical protein
VLLVQGGIHAGEIDGPQGRRLPRPAQAALGKPGQGLLEKPGAGVLPVFNVERACTRFGRLEPAQQRGPEQMGWA